MRARSLRFAWPLPGYSRFLLLQFVIAAMLVGCGGQDEPTGEETRLQIVARCLDETGISTDATEYVVFGSRPTVTYPALRVRASAEAGAFILFSDHGSFADSIPAGEIRVAGGRVIDSEVALVPSPAEKISAERAVTDQRVGLADIPSRMEIEACL